MSSLTPSSTPSAPASASGKYIPRAKLEAERLAAAGQVPPEKKDDSQIFSSAELDEFAPARRHFYEKSDVFKKLQHSKKTFGDKPEVENMFNQHRANSMDKKVTTKFAEQFYVCMNDINETAGNLLVNDSVKRYLDLGCSPGGFSSWVMANNPDASGLGLTLPEEMGGLPMVLFPDGDYEVEYEDITKLDRARGKIQKRHPSGVDLVMAACIYRSRDDPPAESRVPPGVRTTLAISQIILALDALVDQGHFVFVLSNKPDPATIQCLVFLRDLFKSIMPCKGKNLHGIRSSFYLYCEGFDKEAYERTKGHAVLQEALQKIDAASDAWVQKQQAADINADSNSLSLESQTTHPADTMWLPGKDLQELLSKESEFVISFFEKLWLGQIKAIDKRMQELEYRKKPYGAGHGQTKSWQRKEQGEGEREWKKKPAENGEGPSVFANDDWRTSGAPRAGGPKSGWVLATKPQNRHPRPRVERQHVSGQNGDSGNNASDSGVVNRSENGEPGREQRDFDRGFVNGALGSTGSAATKPSRQPIRSGKADQQQMPRPQTDRRPLERNDGRGPVRSAAPKTTPPPGKNAAPARTTILPSSAMLTSKPTAFDWGARPIGSQK